MIRKVIRTATRRDLFNIIVKNDSQVGLYSIMDKIPAQKKVSNLSIDIKSLARILNNIVYFCFNTATKILIDKTAKNTHVKDCSF